MTGNITSNIRLKRPNKKTIKYKVAVQLEQMDIIIKKLEKILDPIGVGIIRGLHDLDFLKEYVEKAFRLDIYERFMETDFGQGYILGFITSMISQETEKDEEDSDSEDN